MSADVLLPGVRPATDADAVALRHIFDDSRAADFAALPHEVRSSVLDLQFAAQSAQFVRSHPNAVTCAIEVDGAVVGRIIVDESDAGIHIVDIAVAAAQRGKGIATEVIGTLLRAASAGASSVSLSVFSGNAAARRLYERLGFTVVDVQGEYTRMVVEGAPAFEPDFRDFASRIGATFDMADPGGADAPLSAVLTECERHPAPEGQSAFAVRFEVDGAPAADQGTFVFSGDGFAAAAIFVVATGFADGRAQYEAIFNRQEGRRS
jgi:ribosomal protein S18 acetylase RimI-like enzyme